MQLNPAGAGNTSQQEVITWDEIKARKITLKRGDTVNLEVAAFSPWPEARPRTVRKRQDRNTDSLMSADPMDMAGIHRDVMYPQWGDKGCEYRPDRCEHGPDDGCEWCCMTCNLDRHFCGGCGTVVGHTDTTCTDCRRTYANVMASTGF